MKYPILGSGPRENGLHAWYIRVEAQANSFTNRSDPRTVADETPIEHPVTRIKAGRPNSSISQRCVTSSRLTDFRFLLDDWQGWMLNRRLLRLSGLSASSRRPIPGL